MELADQEGWHLYLAHPGCGSALIKLARCAERVRVDHLDGVARLQAQFLIGDAVLVAGGYERLRPRLAAFRRRLGVSHPLFDPRESEARVVDSAWITGCRVGVVGYRHRRNRRQVRWLRTSREELRDPGERDPAHSNLAALDPRLRPDRLDSVVAVKGRWQAEEVEGAAGAAGAAHLNADDGEIEQRRDQRTNRCGAGRRKRIVGAKRAEQILRGGSLVAGVLDQRWERAIAELLAGRKANRHRDLNAIANLDVVEPLLQLDLAEESRRRIRFRAQDLERARRGCATNLVATAGGDVQEDEAAEAVGFPLADRPPARIDQRQRLPLAGAQHVSLTDAAARSHSGRTSRAGGDSHQRERRNGTKHYRTDFQHRLLQRIKRRASSLARRVPPTRQQHWRLRPHCR